MGGSRDGPGRAGCAPIRVQGGGGFVRGQVHGGKFVFQFGVDIFPTKFFFFAQFGVLPAPCASSVELVPPSVWRASPAPFVYLR